MPIRILANLLILTRAIVEWFLLWPFVLLRKRRRHLVSFELGDGLRLSEPRGLAARFDKRFSYAAFDATLTRLETSGSIEGVVLALKEPTISLADAILIRRRLERFRSKGRRVVCHFDAADTACMVIARAADTVVMSPPGRITLFGLRFELLFLRDLLHRIGLAGQFIHIGRFKTAAHMFTHRRSSHAQRGNAELLLDDLDRTIESLLTTNRTDSESPWCDVVKARQTGMITHQGYADQLATRLRAEGADEPFDPMATYGQPEQIENNLAQLKKLKPVWLQESTSFTSLRPRPLRLVPLFGTRPAIAVVELSGMILPDSGSKGLTSNRPKITPKAVQRVLERVAKNRAIKGVVLAIDSRGGSALASDLIWRNVRTLAEKKPVVALIRSVAASGGYYIAVAAHEIVATDTSITGSIGVIAGKIVVEKALERANITSEILTNSPFATLLSPRHPFTPLQIDALRNEIRDTYRRFVNRVAIGRSIRSHRVHLLGRGRVFSGNQAKRVGLVDRVGTLDDAIVRVCELANVPTSKCRIRWHELQKPGLMKMLGGVQSFAPQIEILRTFEPAVVEILDLVHLLQNDSVVAYFDGMIEGIT